MAIHHTTGHGYRHRYYACTRRLNKGPEGCSSRLIPASDAEQHAALEVQNRWGDPAHRRRHFERMAATLHAETANAQRRLTAAQASHHRLEARLTDQEARIRADYRAGQITVAELRLNQADLEAERAASLKILRAVERDLQTLRAAGADSSALAAAASRLHQWDVLSVEQQRSILGFLLDSVTLYRGPGWNAPVEMQFAWRGANRAARDPELPVAPEE